MTDNPRPPLWRVIEAADAYMPVHGLLRRRLIAGLIRAVAQYLLDRGLVSTTGGKATPGSDRRLLEALEEEARRAEAGE